jgi:RimJ/RimL family protein N-acetyltransferase
LIVLGSARLTYRRLTAGDLDAFHALAVDPHVRRYLLDGQVVPREWADSELAASEALFASRGVGLWLVAEADETIGFAGFRLFPEVEESPELLYALLERATGRGLATEIAAALVVHARDVGLEPIAAAVDEVNGASVRVLEKVGFRPRDAVPGAFGLIRLFRLDP